MSKQITTEEKITKIAAHVAGSGGYSGVRALVERLNEDQLDDYSWLWDEEDDDNE